MTTHCESRKLAVKKGRVECPNCHRLCNVSVDETTQARNLPAFCSRCGWNGKLNIDNGVCYCDSPSR